MKAHLLPPLLLLCLAPTARAQAVPADRNADQQLVIARSVNPRVAYRGLQADQNPVLVQAPVFPGRAFHGSVEGVLGQAVGDDVLGALGSRTGAPLFGTADAIRLPMTSLAGRQAGSAGHAPLGAMAGATGGIGRIGAGLSGLVVQAVSRSTTGGGP